MRLRRSKVWTPRLLFHTQRNAIHASAPDVRQASPLLSRCRLLVQKDGHVESLCDEGAGFFGEGDTILHRRVSERHKRHDVDSAHAGMNTVMRAQVDRANGCAEQAEHRVSDRSGLTGEGVHGTIVRGI
jgi:hypothetical protein